MYDLVKSAHECIHWRVWCSSFNNLRIILQAFPTRLLQKLKGLALKWSGWLRWLSHPLWSFKSQNVSSDTLLGMLREIASPQSLTKVLNELHLPCMGLLHAVSHAAPISSILQFILDMRPKKGKGERKRNDLKMTTLFYIYVEISHTRPDI